MGVYRWLLSVLLAFTLLLATLVPAIASDSFAADKVKVQIQNKTGEQVRIALTGPATYAFTLSTGKNSVEVVLGRYSYSYKACDGQTIIGKFNVKKAGATLTLPKCKQTKLGGAEVKIAIKNITQGPITIYLSGPQTYAFTFGTGTSKMTIFPGKYSYTVYGCGTMNSGTMNFKGSGKVWTFWCG